MEDGAVYLDEKLISDLLIDSHYIEQEKQKQVQEMQRRKSLYRKGNADYEISNDKIVILIDDGAATGATIIVPSRWIKKNYNHKKMKFILSKGRQDFIRAQSCNMIIYMRNSHDFFYLSLF